MILERPFIFATALIVSLCPAAEADTPAKYMGTGSCSSSNCHGNVRPIKGSDVLQNEYYTWSKHDKHSQAYLNLTKPDGRRMAALMGLGDPTREPLCLKCHSTYVPDTALHGEKFDLEDGVSCESCHGASEKWLSSHAEDGTTHSQNLENGLADTVSLPERAKLCVSCHFGDESKTVNHDLYGAGHPRLSFELDTFGTLQPKHWVVDDDYVKRKANYVPLAAWLAGQFTIAQSTLARLRDPSQNKNGNFPELSLFDCFSCHHSLSEEQWKHRTYEGAPGRLHVNIAPLLMLQAGLQGIDPALARDIESYTSALHTSYQKDGATEALASLPAVLSDRVAPLLRSIQPNKTTCSAVLRGLVDFGSSTPYPKYEIAEQLGMGIQAVLATSPELAKRFEPTLKRIFTTLQSSKTFNPEKFNTAMRDLLKLLS